MQDSYMENHNFGVIIGVILALGIIACFAYKKSHKKGLDPKTLAGVFPNNISVESVDELHMSDIVGYLKGLNLKQGSDIPFLAKGSALKGVVPSTVNYVIGVFDSQTEVVKYAKSFKAIAADKALLDVLGNEKLVVLN